MLSFITLHVMKKFINIISLTLFLLSFHGCSGNGSRTEAGGDTLTSQSDLLTMVRCDGYIIADVDNPWVEGALLERYILVDRDYDDELPEGTVIRVPLTSSIVYSSVYTGAIDELGSAGAITGVADGQYFASSTIADRIRSGEIHDVGNSMSPSIETIVDLDPGAIILSPYQDQQPGAIEKAGIPIVRMADYMEATPLGRAEWIKLIGALYGNFESADSIFGATCKEYTRLCGDVTKRSGRPTVVTEQPLPGGTWDLPAGQSYMARMLHDAGADYPWADTSGAGSLKLDAAAVLDKAADADIWLIRSYGPLTLTALGESSPVVPHFKAFNTGNVYVSDTSIVPLFDEFPFHPDRLLSEYIAIFHPELAGDCPLNYFSRID